jgi:glycolate oxidase FAD binding subunit
MMVSRLGGRAVALVSPGGGGQPGQDLRGGGPPACMLVAPAGSTPSARQEPMAEPFRPTRTGELRELVAAAVAAGTPLEVLGRGSKRALGRPLELAGSVQVDRLVGIGLYEPEELVMSAACGTPLAEIEALLAANQQQLAFEPPDYGALLGGEPGRATIGGVFACNLSGPRRIKAGAARDHLLGIQAVTGRGDLIKSGGRVVKNVTGYDLSKLLAGSFGTLAIMTELTFKVLPAAAETMTLLFVGLERERAFAALRQALGSAHDVAGAACLPPAAAARSSLDPVAAAAGAGVAALRLEGPGPSVEYRAQALRRLLAESGGRVERLNADTSATLWREIRDVELLPSDAPALWRVSLAPADGSVLISRLERELELNWQADWGGGLLWLAVHCAEDGGAAAIRAALAEGGHATLIGAGPELRTAVPVFQPQAPALARLTARVKDSFDPGRILNPGRMYAGL